MCRVVGAGNNKVVGWCGGGVVTCKVINRVWIILLVWIILWMELWMVGKMRKRLRGLYPNQNRPIYDNILTVAPIPAIQETEYLIPVFLTI